jgi:serine/threonine protein kinase
MAALTDDQIVSLCHNPASTVLSEAGCSNKVVRITEGQVVKFGHYVTIHEFKNQQVAQQRLSAGIVNVPAAYRFFKKERIGYIVMDYVDGEMLDFGRAKSMAKELAKVLEYIHLQGSTKPGTLGGGPVSGVLWPEHEEVEFSGPADLQRWFDQRSPSSVQPQQLHRHPLSMCHLDFNPRNIIVSGDRIYLIDWAATGYFPRFFEHVLYQFLPRDICFFNVLKPFLAHLSDEEQKGAETVVQILQHSHFHVL